jgi:hypothetical protein
MEGYPCPCLNLNEQVRQIGVCRTLFFTTSGFSYENRYPSTGRLIHAKGHKQNDTRQIIGLLRVISIMGVLSSRALQHPAVFSTTDDDSASG